MALATKKERLVSLLKGRKPLALALSGGVDSGLLLAVAREVLGEELTVLTSICDLHSQRELSGARHLAEQLGARHIRVESARLQDASLTANARDRCYLCKRIMWQECRAAASSLGISCLLDGVNADDLHEFRPGLTAGKEMGVFSPLAEAGLGKQEVRALARDMGLSFWDKPANSCLATRIPHGTKITLERLRMIDQAETVLLEMGVRQCRVRYDGPVARIEVLEADIEKLTAGSSRQWLVERYSQLGFSHVTIDLAGYGSQRPPSQESDNGKSRN